MNYNILIFNFFLFVWIASIPFKNAVYQVSTISVVLFFLYYIILYKDLSNIKNIIRKYSDLIFCFIIILLIMLLSNIVNNVDSQSWKLTFYYFYRYGLILFILIYFYSKEFFSKKKLFIYIIISLCIQSFDGIFQSIYGFDLFKHNVGDIYHGLTGATSNRNIFAFFMGLGLIITFFYNQNKNKLVYLFSFIFSFNVLFAYSRAIWVSIFVSFIFYILFEYKTFNKKHILNFLGLLIILILIFINFHSLERRLDLLISGYSSNRTDIWLSALPYIKENWLIGHGINSLSDYDIYRGFYSLHNQALEIFFDIGILGLFSFLFLLLIILKELKINYNKRLFYILVFFLVNGNFGESIISSKTMLSTLTIFIFFIFVDRLNNKKRIIK